MKLCTFAASCLLLPPGLFAQSPGPASTPACSFHGRISDTLGAAIDRAFVLLYSDRREKISQQINLNDNGEFTVPLEPGLYDFFIASPGFLPVAKVIDLRACKPFELKLKMQVDKEHLED